MEFQIRFRTAYDGLRNRLISPSLRFDAILSDGTTQMERKMIRTTPPP